MKKFALARLFSLVSSFSLLANSIFYPFAVAYAQSAEPTSTPEAIIETTPTPTEEPVVSPTPEETVDPEVSPTPQILPTTEDVVPLVEETESPLPEPTDIPLVEPEVNENSQSLAPPTTESNLSPTSSFEENGEISAIVLENIQASSIEKYDLTIEQETSAAIITDKPDYAPTDTVLITGTGFIPLKTYDLVITGTGGFEFSDKTTSDEVGNLFYAYQLDGTYRPDYKVEIKSNGIVICSVTFTDGVWPGSWNNYLTSGGQIVNDFENKLYGIIDDSNGGTDVSPTGIDIASGGLKSGSNPGDYSSLQYYYDDAGSAGDCSDDFLFLRMRLVGDPTVSGGSAYYTSYHWDFLVDADGNGQSDFVVDIHGGKTPGAEVYGGDKGTLGIYPNIIGSTTYDQNNYLWVVRADASTNLYTRMTNENYSDADSTNDQYWIEVALPLNSNPVFQAALCEHSNLSGRLFASTSSSETDPLQKDWMGSDAFFVQSTLHKSVENITHPGATTLENPALPGDVLVYTLSVENTGTLEIPGYVISDDITDLLEYSEVTSYDYDGNGRDGTLLAGIISWLSQDISVGQTVTEQFAVTIKSSSLWPTSGNYILTNTFGDTLNVYLPPSGTINVYKDVQGPAGEDITDISETFKITLDGGDERSITDGGTVTYLDVPAGNHTVLESLIPQGYDFYSYSLDSDTNTPGAQITVPAGGSVDLYIVNRQKYTTLKVVKTAYDISGGIISPDNFVLKIDGNQVTNNVAENVTPGTYTVSEVTVDGFTGVINGDCDSGGSVSLNLGDNKVCTITNTRDSGRLLVYKIVDDGTDLTNWSFSLDGAPAVSADSTGLVDFGQVTTLDNHSIIETGPLGIYTLSSVSGTNCTPSILTNSATATVVKGETTTCTFSNVINKGSITIIKDANPDGPQDFDFKLEKLNIGAAPTEIGVATLDDDSDPANDNQAIFGSLFPGSYVVTEGLVNGWDTVINCNDGSYTWPVVGRFANLEVSPGENITCTFTNTQRGSISGHKWEDLNANGVEDAGEPRVAGVQICLDANSNGNCDAGEVSVNTDSSGDYLFENLIPGIYTIAEYQGSGSWQQSYPGQATGKKHTVDLSAGETETGYNFGNYKNANICFKKFEDLNGDGVWQEGEAYLSNWEMKLWESDGQDNLIQLPHTFYSNTCTGMLTPGKTYFVSEKVEDGWTQTYPGDNGYIGPFVATSQARFEAVFGNFENTYWSGFKYEDFDGDGVKDAEDTPLENWTFELQKYVDGSWEVVDTETTDVLGAWSFPITKAGKYRVHEQPQINWNPTTYVSGYYSDGGIIVGSGASPIVNIIFMNYEQSTITGYKYNDLNGNGSFDTGEPRVPGVLMTLYRNGEFYASLDTDAGGSARFTGLPAGTYRIEEDVNDSDLDGWYSTNSTTFYDNIVITSGSNIAKNFFNAPYRTIKGYKYNDLDRDGEKDPGEPGLSDWKIYLDSNGNDQWDLGEKFEITDSSGYYEFEDLVIDVYIVREVLEGLWKQSDPVGGEYVINTSLSVISDDINFGNWVMNPELTLTKTNDKPNASAGNTVNYTLVVKNSGDMDLFEIEVTDVLPGGFEYIPGTSRINMIPVEPVIGSGTLRWLINLMEGQEKTITYQVKVGSDLKPGVYTNLAVCKTMESPIEDEALDLPFVGATAVRLPFVSAECNDGVPVTSTVSLGEVYSYSAGLTPQVLGASTELPATGSSTWYLVFITIGTLGGVALKVVGKRIKNENN